MKYNVRKQIVMCMAAAVMISGTAMASDTRDIGAVSTEFKLIGPNSKIAVSAFNDPKVGGVTCYVARPKVGGFKGGLGIAENPSIAAVSCAQTGPITYSAPIETGEKGEKVFDENRSLIFKTLQIDRLYDKENGTLVYVARTTKIINGSPMTAISVVAPVTWNGTEAQKPELK